MPTWIPRDTGLSLQQQALAIQGIGEQSQQVAYSDAEIIGGAITGPGTPTPSPGERIPGTFSYASELVTGAVPGVGGAGSLARYLPWLLAAGGAALDFFTPGGLIDTGGGAPSNQPRLTGPGPDVPLVGPGLLEPPAWMVAKEWTVNNAQFYKLIDGRIAVYSKKKRTWKVYRPAKHIVIPRDPKASQLIRASKKVDSLMNTLARKAGFVKRSSARGSTKKQRYAVPSGTQIISVD